MNNDMEDKEWLDAHISLKQVSPKSPFTVPEGYFDEMGQRITSYIQLDELKTGDKGFTVPENYFDELSANIQSRINIEELAAAENTGFEVPEGYFDELSANIQSRINIEELAAAENTGFEVPANYFEELQQKITARITVEEALEASDKDFAVPEGYFDKLNKSILDKTVKQDITVRRGIVRKMFATGAFKYAAAACFAVIIGTGVLISQLTGPAVVDHNHSYLHEQLSTVSISDIQSYLQQDVDAGETQHTATAVGSKVSDASLSNALQDYVDTDN